MLKNYKTQKPNTKKRVNYNLSRLTIANVNPCDANGKLNQDTDELQQALQLVFKLNNGDIRLLAFVHNHKFPEFVHPQTSHSSIISSLPVFKTHPALSKDFGSVDLFDDADWHTFCLNNPTFAEIESKRIFDIAVQQGITQYAKGKKLINSHFIKFYLQSYCIINAATAQNHSNSNAKDQNNVPTDSKLE